MQMCVPQSERYKLEDQVCIKNQQHIKVVFLSRSFHFCLTWKSPKNWWYMSKAEKFWFVGRTSSEISPSGYPRAHHATLSTQISCSCLKGILWPKNCRKQVRWSAYWGGLKKENMYWRNENGDAKQRVVLTSLLSLLGLASLKASSPVSFLYSSKTDTKCG